MLTHRRHNGKLTNGYAVLFAESGNEGYGEHCWTLQTDLPHVESDERLIAFAMDWIGCDREEAITALNPVNIVSSAYAWDDAQFVSDVWQAFEPTGYTTNDGAVVIDIHAVELSYEIIEGC